MLLGRRVALAGIFAISLAAPALADSVLVTGLNGAGSSTTETATDGASLWSLTGGSLTLATYPSTFNTKNEILQYYVVANGFSGSSVFSLGELNGSGFGTNAVNIQITGGQTSLIDASAPTRNVSGLTNLSIYAVPALTKGAGGQSTSVAVTGGSNPGNYNQSQLQSFASANGGAVQSSSNPTYTGISLSTLLLSNMPITTVLNSIVVTQGTDGYEVVLAAGELANNPNAILAYASTGSDFPDAGVARTIYPDDAKHGRWMSNLAAIDVASVPTVTAVPGPIVGAGLPGLLAGLGAMLAWRRKRRAAV